MAASDNLVILLGNVGQAPEFVDHGNGFVTASFFLVTEKRFKDRITKESRVRTDWHRVEAVGRLAEIVRDIVGKGAQVYVRGELNTDRVERADAPGQFNYYTKVRAETIQKLGKRDRSGDGPEGDGGSDDGDDGGQDGSTPGAAQAPTQGGAPASGNRGTGRGYGKPRSR